MSHVSISIPDPSVLDVNDIQGDIILSIPKRVQDFIFFSIADATSFKKALKALTPLITTTAQVISNREAINEHKKTGFKNLLKSAGINISFSYPGLQKLGVTDSLKDEAFEAGQLAHAKQLGDAGTPKEDGTFDPNWLPGFKQEIHGMIFIAAESESTLRLATRDVQSIFRGSIKEVITISGKARPGNEKGHEHFGFLDGVSNPAVEVLTPPLPGQHVVPPGILVMGLDGDNVTTRPSWAKNGSFLVYRNLQQLVPEFNKFLNDNPVDLPGLPRDQGSELLGARLVGRWKSGAPTALTPLKDDPALGADPQRNNDFTFSEVPLNDQSRCPFAAHIRKTNPRDDLITLPGAGLPAIQRHSIIRAGIPIGPEVTVRERLANKTQEQRGLAFVCYQSSITDGFEFMQEAWANTESFPPKNGFVSGYDPIIGQDNGNPRTMAGTNPDAQSVNITLPQDFVVAQGGVYLFAPSITALNTVLTQA